ncbi:hypothetical protein M1E17_03760 [Arthrobacter sp. D1-29]
MQQVIHVSPETSSERDLRLNAAIDVAMSIAIKDRAGGILITRNAPAIFTVAITPEVPYGLVREADGTTARDQLQSFGQEEAGGVKKEDSASESGDGPWDRLWEPAARHYRDMEHLPQATKEGRLHPAADG